MPEVYWEGNVLAWSTPGCAWECLVFPVCSVFTFSSIGGTRDAAVKLVYLWSISLVSELSLWSLEFANFKNEELFLIDSMSE